MQCRRPRLFPSGKTYWVAGHSTLSRIRAAVPDARAGGRDSHGFEGRRLMILARCLAVALAVVALAGCRPSQQAIQTAPPPPPAVGVQQARIKNVAPSNPLVR